MLKVVMGTVLSVVEEGDHLQLLEVGCADGQEGMQRERAVFFSSGADRCQVGDQVLLNVTAVRLGLGTGGHHFVIGKCGSRTSDYHPNRWGHIVKMRYAPWQLAVDAVEEQNSPWHAIFQDETRHLQRTPVLIGELHSLLPFLVLALKRIRPQARLVYVMPDGAALTIAISRHVRHLRQLGLLHATVTCGHAWGGDLEAVNLYTGLLAARHVAQAEFILCLLGPGVVGTGTAYGFSGMQLAEVIHAVSLLGGIPIFVPRISFSDPRSRHYGISHHSMTLLKRFVLVPALVTVPRFGDMRDDVLSTQERQARLYARHVRLSGTAVSPLLIEELQREYPEAITTMGRDSRVDPAPAQTACLAAEAADFCRRWLGQESADGWVQSKGSGMPQGGCPHSTEGCWQEADDSLLRAASVLPPDRDELTTLARSWACWRDDAR